MAGFNVKLKPLEAARRKYYKAAGNSPEYFRQMTDELAEVALNWMQFYTPVKSGALRDAWRIIHTGKYVNTIENPLEYASHVNDGHWMGRDRFVPGFWSGDIFVYQKYSGKSHGGMYVRNQWVDGHQMLEKTVAMVEDYEAEKYGRKIVDKIRGDLK